MRTPPFAVQLPLVWDAEPTGAAGGPTAAELEAQPREGLGAVAGTPVDAKTRRAAIMAERLLRYHHSGRGGSAAHRLAGALLAEHGRDARLVLQRASLARDVARRVDQHLATAGVPAATRRHRERRSAQRAAWRTAAEALHAEHGREARVVLRRQRWEGHLDKPAYRAMDGHLAALGVPARLQIDLLGGDDAAL